MLFEAFFCAFVFSSKKEGALLYFIEEALTVLMVSDLTSLSSPSSELEAVGFWIVSETFIQSFFSSVLNFLTLLKKASLY